MKELPKVSIIVLNWNGLEDTRECLRSLQRTTYPSYDVILVDNASTGNDVQALRAEFKDYIHIIQNDRNYGFTGGNNIGARYALGNSDSDYLLLLNNDTVVDSQFLAELVRVSEGDPSVGIAGPKTYLYHDFHRLQLVWIKLDMWKGKASHVGSREIDRGHYENIREIDCVQGSCLLVKRNVIEQIGLLDERYFGYWEEVDYCVRAKKAGYKIVYVPAAKIWHKALQIAKNHEYHMARNRFWFMKKHATRSQLVSFMLWFFIFELWFQSGVYLLYHRDWKLFVSLYRGIIHGLRAS